MLRLWLQFGWLSHSCPPDPVSACPINQSLAVSTSRDSHIRKHSASGPLTTLEIQVIEGAGSLSASFAGGECEFAGRYGTGIECGLCMWLFDFLFAFTRFDKDDL